MQPIANTLRGQEVWALVSSDPQALSGLSIGYMVQHDAYDKEGNRQLKAVDLWELSLVSLPANDRARLDQPAKSAMCSMKFDHVSKLDERFQELRQLITDHAHAGFSPLPHGDDAAEAVDGALKRLRLTLARS